jgi:hypothetical protein
MLTRYFVEPALHSDFIGQWQDTADDVYDREKGAIRYSLRKVCGAGWGRAGTQRLRAGCGIPLPAAH